MPVKGHSSPNARRPAASPACVPALPLAINQVRLWQCPVRTLPDKFPGALDIAERAQRVGAAAGNHVGACVRCAASLAALGRQRHIHVRAARHRIQDRHRTSGRVARCRTSPYWASSQSIRCSSSASQARPAAAAAAAVWRTWLDCTAPWVTRVSAPASKCVRHQELQLARLVAAHCKAGAVVALDEQARAAEPGLQSRQRRRAALATGPDCSGETSRMFVRPSVILVSGSCVEPGTLRCNGYPRSNAECSGQLFRNS